MKSPLPQLQSLLRKYTKKRKNIVKAQSSDTMLLRFFWGLFFLLTWRLFDLQVVQWQYYQDKLLDQHYTRSSLEAKRWNIFTQDKSGEKIQLTENIDLFTLFVDPKHIIDKQQLIQDLTPVLYEHFCEFYRLSEPDQLQCLQNLENFTKQKYLPEKKYVFYMTGVVADEVAVQDYDGEYTTALQDLYALATPEWIQEEILATLDTLIQIWYKPQNYVGNFEETPWLIAQLQEMDLAYVDIVDDAYVYITPTKVTNRDRSARTLNKLFGSYDIDIHPDVVRDRILVSQENRYVKIATDLNIMLVDKIKNKKEDYRTQRSKQIDLKKEYNALKKQQDSWIAVTIPQELLDIASVDVSPYPSMYALGFEQSHTRYYPYETFMSHIVWYLDDEENAFYGVEQYFDELLAGKDGKIVWLATPWIWQIWSNNIVVEQPQNGSDVYLTIDPIVQKEVETIVRKRHGYLAADSIAVTILDPNTGKVESLVNYPTYNPNSYADAYKMKPLTRADRFVVEDETRIDVPVFVMSGSQLLAATTEQRKDLTLKKYFFENYLWPQVFVDKNISYPYEPGSVFKSLALAIGVDSDAFSMYDFHNDPGLVKIGQYTIANISYICTGTHTFLHALEHSCNVGMVRMAQKMLKYVFYSYLDKLGFGEKTGIELANEEPWLIPDFNTVSKAWFFTNTYGAGMLATPLQMAASYATLVNGGRYIKPTIVEAIYSQQKKRYIELASQEKSKVLKLETSEEMKDALASVVRNWNLNEELYFPGLSVWGKTGTSEIIYKGKFREGKWWTNTSFVWVTTAQDPRYIVAIQVRRPRSSQRWLDTAWLLFDEIADFLIAYGQIEY